MTLAMELRKFKEEGKEEGRVEGRAEGRAEGIVEGISQNNQFVIKKLVGRNMPIDTIAEIVGQSPQYVQQVIDGMQIPQPANR